MSRKIRLGEKVYEAESLGQQGRATLAALDQIDVRIAELSNLLSALGRAREGYTNDLKREVIKGRSGIDIATLISE